VKVYYDQDCNFCLKTLNWLSSRVDDEFELAPLKRFIDDYPDQSQLMMELGMITVSNNRKEVGYGAFKILIKECGAPRYLLAIFSVPFFSDFFGPIIYRYIAKNRNRFGCDSNCSLEHKHN